MIVMKVGKKNKQQHNVVLRTEMLVQKQLCVF